MSREHEVRGIVEIFVKGYNQRFATTWCSPDWLDISPADPTKERVEVIYHSQDGRRLAVEHTLLEPFEGELYERSLLDKTLGFLEDDRSLVVPGFYISLGVAVGDIRKLNRKEREALKSPVRAWIAKVTKSLKTNTDEWQYFRQGLVPLSHDVELNALYDPLYTGFVRVKGTNPPKSFATTVEKKALSENISKLAAAPADKRILLLERNIRMYTSWELAKAIDSVSAHAGDIQQIDEIFDVDTSVHGPAGPLIFVWVWPNGVGPGFVSPITKPSKGPISSGS